MKKYLSIYTLLALTCIVLQSCLFSEEEIFDESSANRATADVICLLYTSPSPRDRQKSRMPSSA